MAAPECLPLLLIMGLALQNLPNSAQVSTENAPRAPERPSVSISDDSPGVITVSWEPHLTEHMRNFTVLYLFLHKFSSEAIWLRERTPYTQATINVNSHSKVLIKVKTLLFREADVRSFVTPVAESNWTEIFYSVQPAPVENLSCIAYELSSLNCTWKPVKNLSPGDAELLFTVRYRNKEFTCQKYLLNDEKRKVGCHLKDILFINTTEERNGSLNVTVWCNCLLALVYRSFLPDHIEILNAPRNVTLNPEEGDLRVIWVQPLTLGSSAPDCFLYQVEITEANKKLPKHEKGEVEGKAEYIFPSYDKTKKYSVRIRAKKYCPSAKSKYWGEWSEPVFIGHDDGVAAWIVALIISVPITIMCLLLRYMCKRYGWLDMIFTTIPDPSIKLKQWLASNESYSEHFVFYQNEVVTTIEVLTDCKPGPAPREKEGSMTRCLEQHELNVTSAATRAWILNEVNHSSYKDVDL